MCALAFGYELWLLVQGGEDALNAFIERRGLVAADLVEAWQAGEFASAATLGLVTHVLLHGSWLHLFGNLLFLWIFGPNVEDRLGRVTFLALFAAGGLAAAGLQVAVDPTADLPMVGASGAISAVLGAYLVLFPRARIQSLVFLVFFYELIAVPSVLVLGFWFAAPADRRLRLAGADRRDRRRDRVLGPHRRVPRGRAARAPAAVRAARSAAATRRRRVVPAPGPAADRAGAGDGAPARAAARRRAADRHHRRRAADRPRNRAPGAAEVPHRRRVG